VFVLIYRKYWNCILESLSKTLNMDDDIVKTLLMSESVDTTKKENYNVWKFFNKIGKDKDGA